MLSFHCLLFSVVLLSCFKDALFLSSQKKEECVQEIYQWCNKNSYDPKGHSSDQTVINIETPVNGKNTHIQCTMDYEGTNCYKMPKKSSWVHCLPNHDVTYNGKTLRSSNADNEICDAKKAALNSGYHVKFNQKEFDMRMKRFNRQLAERLTQFAH